MPESQQHKETVKPAARYGEQNSRHSEGRVAIAIEQRTAKIPSDFFLWGAMGSMALSAGLTLAGAKQIGTFVGQWVPTILILGLYNKLVKVIGSDPKTRKA